MVYHSDLGSSWAGHGSKSLLCFRIYRALHAEGQWRLFAGFIVRRLGVGVHDDCRI